MLGNIHIYNKYIHNSTVKKAKLQQYNNYSTVKKKNKITTNLVKDLTGAFLQLMNQSSLHSTQQNESSQWAKEE